MENGENAVALEQQQKQPNENRIDDATGVEELQTPTKSTHSSAADDDSHVHMLDNKESK